MKYGKFTVGLRFIILATLLLTLAGCGGPVRHPLWFLYPNGPIASASIYYLIVDVLLLLVVIVPATALVIWTFFRYRKGGKGEYDPTRNHSVVVEFVVWGVPLVIVVVLAILVSYQGSFAVDPFNPQAVESATAHSNNQKPLHIDVISTDWQWLFIYPKQNIAMANRLVVPTGRKISMKLTSAGVTNDFYILKVVNQIYLMPGMRTKMNFLMTRPGTYQGYSTAFSGPGFSWMNYKMLSVTPQKFRHWVQRARHSDKSMSWQDFKTFAQPTINTGNTWTLYSPVQPGLFRKLIRRVKSGQFQSRWKGHLSDEMTSKEFMRKYGTGKPQSGQSGTTVNSSDIPPDS